VEGSQGRAECATGHVKCGPGWTERAPERVEGVPAEGAGIRVPFPVDLRAGVFLARPNRFLCRVLLEGQPGTPMGDPVEAHLPDPGRLRELLVPGRRVRVEAASNPARKTRWTLRLVETPDRSGWVSLDTTLPNRLVERALRARALEEFQGWMVERAEVTRGGSRFDFLLRDAAGRELILEVKSVTLVEEGVALFPDAVTARGARHLRELTALRRGGQAAAVLFVAQREDVGEICAAAAIDPGFSAALEEAAAAGVRILGRRCRVDLNGVTLLDAVPAGLR
jgi:sugar fermentation stimulation protein A